MTHEADPRHPGALSADAADYARIADAIEFLRENRQAQPDLRALAAHLSLSESHVQRLFSRWAGISPKRFLQHLTVADIKRRMHETADLLGLALDAGLSGPGRLHDLFVSMEAMSPGEFKRAARGITIRYGTGPSPFGMAQIAFTARGICHLSFVDDEPAVMAQTWPDARLQRDDDAAAALLARVFAAPGGGRSGGLALWIGGTNFQIQVWRALLQVPFGGLLSYRRLAGLVGKPQAARAVGSAVARNPIAFLIPCHRILRESGDVGQYYWGASRKHAMCGWEASRSDGSPDD